MSLTDYEVKLFDAVAQEARQYACALPPLPKSSDAAYRAGMTNDIVRALAQGDLHRVAVIALGAEMALAYRAHRKARPVPASPTHPGHESERA